MKINNIYLKIIIAILCFIIFILFSFLLGTHSYSNDSTIPIIIMIFGLVVVGIFYICYIIFHKKIFLILIILYLLYMIFSMIRGMLYEYKVDKLHIGMTKVEVENLYGIGSSGIGFGSSGLGSAKCLKCNGKSYQFYYRLNSNLWYSHLEDSYHVCYIDDIVCDFDRIGL